MTTYEAGKTYEINHERKGKMTVLVNHVDENGPWVQATIVAGRAVGVRGDVQAAKGDELTFRASFTKILREVPQSQQPQPEPSMTWKRERIKGTHFTSVSYAVPRHVRPPVWAGKTENGWSAQFAYGEGGYTVGGMKTRDQALSELLKLRDKNQSN